MILGFNSIGRGLILSFLLLPGMVIGRTLHVGQSHSFMTVVEAISASKAGDTLLIHAGNYEEFNLLIPHELTLLGEGQVVLDGRQQGEILKITGDGVHVEGITFRRSGLSHLDENAAVRFEETNGGILRSNRFEDNFFAVYLARASNIKIEDNIMSGSSISESRSGNAIHLWYCRDINIERNRVSGHRDGIYLEFVENCTISGNESFENLRYGLHFMYSDHNQYDNNRFTNNGAGVAVMYSRFVDMWDNTFDQNWGTAAYGLLLKDIYDSKILSNTFVGNTIALYAEACNRVVVSGNSFKQNGWAVKIMANSMDNSFDSNNFLNNTFDVATNSRQNFNRFNGNYWSRYRGYDLDSDGVGDIPFRPVKLFSLMTEQNEHALVLLRSVFVEIMDVAESYIPILTPPTLMDEKPRMEPML